MSVETTKISRTQFLDGHPPTTIGSNALRLTAQQELQREELPRSGPTSRNTTKNDRRDDEEELPRISGPTRTRRGDERSRPTRRGGRATITPNEESRSLDDGLLDSNERTQHNRSTGRRDSLYSDRSLDSSRAMDAYMSKLAVQDNLNYYTDSKGNLTLLPNGISSKTRARDCTVFQWDVKRGDTFYKFLRNISSNQTLPSLRDDLLECLSRYKNRQAATDVPLQANTTLKVYIPNGIVDQYHLR